MDLCLLFISADDVLKGEWSKGITFSLIKLGLEFHPDKEKN